ncbi:hypothetical protein K2X85_09385 [bacterium]|jgi:hypothetical protein|nr:hypothetical protein [bacterium]
MNRHALAERIRIESQILAFVREAMIVALQAPITTKVAPQWAERSRFLIDSFERHVSRLFRIKWEVDDQFLISTTENPGLIDDLVQLEAQERELSLELRDLGLEARGLAPDNVANLYAYRQRALGFLERFDEIRLRECKIWLDAFEIEIGGEG